MGAFIAAITALFSGLPSLVTLINKLVSLFKTTEVAQEQTVAQQEQAEEKQINETGRPK